MFTNRHNIFNTGQAKEVEKVEEEVEERNGQIKTNKTTNEHPIEQIYRSAVVCDCNVSILGRLVVHLKCNSSFIPSFVEQCELQIDLCAPIQVISNKNK